MCLLLVGVSFALWSCGTTPTAGPSPTDSLGSAASAPSSSDTTSTSSPAQAYVNDLVGEAQIGSAYLVPKAVTLSDGAKSFVPPEAFPVYRTVPAGPITQEGMDALADKLGVGPTRTYYGSNGLSDPRWNLTFYHGDIGCFGLTDLLFDQGISKQIEAGKVITAVAPERAREVADKYLASSGYADGLEFAETFVRTSIGGSGGGKPDFNYTITMGVSYSTKLDGIRLIGVGATVDVGPDGQVVAFSHTVQKTEPAGEVKLRPIAEAVEDLRAGRGQCPTGAGDLSSVSVESIEVVYYAPPRGLTETYYKPIYDFHVRMADGKTGEWLLSSFDVPTSASGTSTAGHPPSAAVTNIGGVEPSTDPTTTLTRTTTATPLPVVLMGVIDGHIPTPLIDGAFWYHGNGHFSRAKGEDFYWRDGHFVNPDGSPLQVPESIKQKMREKGYTGELTQPSLR